MGKKKPQLASLKECTGCLACIDSCHQKAITSFTGTDGHYYIQINYEQCVGCYLCESACPIVSMQDYGQSELTECYAVWNTNREDRAKSASGGAFSAMARYVLQQGGIVIGAATENICDVRHVAISNISDLYKLQGSKYTQSNTCGIYQQTYQLLKDGKEVLFSGTGCQVGALLSFLTNKKYSGRLITVDLICGGVPSKLLLQKFVENEPYPIKKIVSYRNKEHGWKPQGFRYNLKVEDTKGNIHDYTEKRNIVTDGYGSQMTNRWSCYDCKFVGLNRKSDFTIGDLWGDSHFPQEHFQGVSALIVHNSYAKRLIEKMAPYVEVHAIEERYVTTCNHRISNGRNRRKYFIERMFLGWIFNHLSYSTLKKIYAFDYPPYSPWMLYKAFIYILKKIFK